MCGWQQPTRWCGAAIEERTTENNGRRRLADCGLNQKEKERLRRSINQIKQPAAAAPKHAHTQLNAPLNLIGAGAEIEIEISSVSGGGGGLLLFFDPSERASRRCLPPPPFLSRPPKRPPWPSCSDPSLLSHTLAPPHATGRPLFCPRSPLHRARQLRRLTERKDGDGGETTTSQQQHAPAPAPRRHNGSSGAPLGPARLHKSRPRRRLCAVWTTGLGSSTSAPCPAARPRRRLAHGSSALLAHGRRPVRQRRGLPAPDADGRLDVAAQKEQQQEAQQRRGGCVVPFVPAPARMFGPTKMNLMNCRISLASSMKSLDPNRTCLTTTTEQGPAADEGPAALG